uniref:Alginate lyase domain-containing protein n=1 Tax=Fusarium oxysporum (strain Fo5176) TaxID=660025 RepID=A0A0C4DI85_FUSOF
MKLQFLMLGLEASSALKSVYAASDSKATPYFPIPTNAPKTWDHPGVFVSGPQLDHIAKKIEAKENPWTEALDSMLNMSYISPTRTAEPYETVQCGPTSTPNIGCYQEREDSMAAYMNALAWWITKDKHYAEKSIHYMDAWSSTIQGHNNSNAPLQAAWSAANWVRAGEIMRSSYEHWSKKSIKTFSDMLRHAYIPIIEDGAPQKNGNWELVMIESTIGAAVFLEDAALYEKSLELFSGRVPAYIYLTSDGKYPVQGRGGINTTAEIIKFWHNQKTFPISGITQETCRDFAHTSFGISSISHIAETLRIQGYHARTARQLFTATVALAMDYPSVLWLHAQAGIRKYINIKTLPKRHPLAAVKVSMSRRYVSPLKNLTLSHDGSGSGWLNASN